MSKRKGKAAHSETAVLEHGHDTDDENLREDSVMAHASDVEDNETVSVSIAGLESDEDDSAVLGDPNYTQSDVDDDESDEVVPEDSDEEGGVETTPTNPDSVYARLLHCAQQHDPDFQPKRASEPYKAFVQRLREAVFAAPEEAWNDMGEDAQVVYNALAKATGQMPEIPGLNPDAPITRLPPVVKVAKPTSPEQLAERAATKARRHALREAKRLAKEQARANKPQSKVQLVRAYLLEQLPHELSLETIISNMAERGIELQKTTMMTLRHEFYAIVKQMRKQGFLREGV